LKKHENTSKDQRNLQENLLPSRNRPFFYSIESLTRHNLTLRSKPHFFNSFLAMSLHVQSLDYLPANAPRGYYVYLLDYGWREPLGEALRNNFQRMAVVNLTVPYLK
jgi:hypothetical protein